MRRFLRRIGALALLLLALCTLPIVGTELSCKVPPVPAPVATPLIEPAFRRAEGDSFLSYPEWYIVHAYADLAAVTAQSSESSFDYVQAIGDFWRSLCGATRTATAIGSTTMDQRVTNYIIGLSFSAEMAIKGAWERTLGALAVWTRGPVRTAEDDYALSVAQDYAAFLHQTPWYRYPFGDKLRHLWSDVPRTGPNGFRKAERRLALSLEWGGKALYAKAMEMAAGLSPADLRLRSIVRGLTAEDRAAIPEIVVVGERDGGQVEIETPRYEAFNGVLRALAGRGREFVEIAGNGRILITVLAQEGKMLDGSDIRPIFSLPIQSRAGYRRVGLDTDVSALTGRITALERAGVSFEHAYDY